MMAIFCHDQHGEGPGLCDECRGLLAYAHRRLDACPFQEHKPACNHCAVHCYSATMKERVKSVMRYAGPRMPLRHPLLALMHLLDGMRRAPVLQRRGRRAPPTGNAGATDKDA